MVSLSNHSTLLCLERPSEMWDVRRSENYRIVIPAKAEIQKKTFSGFPAWNHRKDLVLLDPRFHGDDTASV